jgi:hypothetical protein
MLHVIHILYTNCTRVDKAIANEPDLPAGTMPTPLMVVYGVSKAFDLANLLFWSLEPIS